MFERIKSLGGDPREPNYRQWANTIRLMRERDRRTDEKIRRVFTWANQDGFWYSNVLSPGSLREKWNTLVLKAKEVSDGRPNGVTQTGSGRGNGRSKEAEANSGPPPAGEHPNMRYV